MERIRRLTFLSWSHDDRFIVRERSYPAIVLPVLVIANSTLFNNTEDSLERRLLVDLRPERDDNPFHHLSVSLLVGFLDHVVTECLEKLVSDLLLSITAILDS